VLRFWKVMMVLPAVVLGWAVLALTANQTARASSSIAHPKRGIASAKYLSADPAKLAKLGATWSYDWSATPPPKTAGLQWVPMIWGLGSITPSSIATLTAARRSGRARYLLGFNEPDNSGQSNMTPSQAAALWPKLEKTGLKLGSPAPAVPTDGWLARFMTIARHRHLRVNFIALHYYQDFTNPDAVQQLRSQLIAIHKQFHKPIWITEIGTMNISAWGSPMLHRPTYAAVISYMRKLFPMLDELPFVQRYAWFTDACWNDSGCRYSSLFNARGRVTEIDRTFRSAA
jgi:hypothetical protein